jgi:hypothetical protein
MLWGRGWEQAEQKEVLGLRVRAKLASGNLEGNVIWVEGSRVQVRGTLECGEKGAKICKLVTEEVELKACRFVEDRLTWHDHDIPSTAVRRVEFQKNAKQNSDFLEETVVEMMLKWGFYGHTADQGLRPASTRQWVASVWEYPHLLQAWSTVKDSDEPLIELLHLLSQQEQEPQRSGGRRPATKVKYLPVDPALYDFIFIPICIPQGKHWLLASIDVQKREMQLLDCSKEYGGRWRGQIHSILWVWFVASVRRLRARGVAIPEEPRWRIDISRVNLLDVAELPGLNSSRVRDHLVECGVKKCPPDVAKLLGGADRSRLAALNITVEEDRFNPRQWCWSSNDGEVPQQRRGSDCGPLTVLFAIFKARGWEMRTLDSLDPQRMRNWFLEVLNRQGQWSRAWSCTQCGAEVTRRVTADNTYQCLANVTCGTAQSRICETRRSKRSKHQQPETAGARGTGCEEGGTQQHTGLGKRGAGEQSPKRTNFCEASAGGQHEQGTLDRRPMTAGAREPRSAECDTGAAYTDRRATGMEGGASDIEDGKPEDAGLPGQAVGGERSATETPGVAKAPPQTTSGARSQAMHRKVFHVEITGQQCAKVCVVRPMGSKTFSRC